MTISELITRLQELQAKHGDLPVWTEDEWFAAYEVEDVQPDEINRKIAGKFIPDRITLVGQRQ